MVKEEIESVARLDFASLEGGRSRSATGDRIDIEIHASLEELGKGLQSLTKYTDPNVARLAVSGTRPSRLGVAEADVTVFFSDMAGFTGIAETLNPHKFMDLLGTYLSEMSAIIMESDGIVGEFIGDAIMAWWNVPKSVGRRHTCVALHAALRQQHRLAELRAQWLAQGLPEVRARMGLVRGRVLAGNIGSPERMKYGLVGDSVNLASRLESLCKTYGVGILIDGAAASAPGVAEEFYLREVDQAAVKGRRAPTELFELIGSRRAFEEGGSDITCQQLCEAFAGAHACYRQADFEGALRHLEEAEKLRPGDVPARILRERCQVLREAGPLSPADWSPTHRLDHK